MSLPRPRRKQLYMLAVFLVFCFYMLWPVNFYLAETIKSTYYMIFVPLLVGGVLYFRGLRDGMEFRLLAAYWLWFWITRVINENAALQEDFELFFDLGLMLPLFALGLTVIILSMSSRFTEWLRKKMFV